MFYPVFLSSSAPINALQSSSSSNNHAGVIAGGIFGGLVLCDLLVCGVIMYNRRQRRVRRTRIQQLLVESGLGLGKTDSIEYVSDDQL